MATTRAYILAKELGVKSSAIVKKCQAEGLDVKNHMSVISAGLAATIREWFSEEGGTTAVETATKVDLKKVRIKKKVKRKKKTKEAESEVLEETQAKAVKKKKTAKKTQAAAQAVVETDAEVTGAVEEKVEAKAEEVQADTIEQVRLPEPLPEPEPIVPAGPMLGKPEPARLAGPKVVRVEAPEQLDRPRPRPKPKSRPRYDKPVTEPLMQDLKPKEVSQSLTAKSSKRVARVSKERTHGRRRADKPEDSPRRFRFAEQRHKRDLEERQARLNAISGQSQRSRPIRKITTKAYASGGVVAKPTQATISEPITVKDLSAALAVKINDIIRKLMVQGVMVSANQTITSEVAELVSLEFGTELTVERRKTIIEQIEKEFEQLQKTNLKKRSVVVTMLGHVDHGKTSLLDKIRSTHVTAGEAGGITQHIGAYQVSFGENKVTFLDTPGHEAFTAMRARGANMTDVVVLVIAADDGVMPQTIEAVHHARAANVPIIVALNKIDLPGCNLNRIYSQLAEYELTPSEWGGKTEVVKTSAITGEGIDDLLEHLDYITELLDLQADDIIAATGWVVEAEMSAQRGAIATLLTKEGQLKKGDVILAGSSFGRIKSLKNSFGKSIKTAISSMPVEITGLNDVPQAGDKFYVLDDINKAKMAAEEIRTRAREDTLAKRTQITLDNLFSQIEAGNVKELNLIIRADVQGSVDVLTKYLSELSTDEVKVRILHAAPGGITEGDVVLAEASNAIIVGFNVVSNEHVAKIAESKGVEIRFYNIIYRITEDLKKSMEGLLEPEEQEKTLGRAVVRNIFKISKVGTIAGCYVSSGIVNNKAKVRLIRDNIVIRDDLVVETLRHFKDDAREVKAGLECGIKIAKFDDIKIDDILDFYEIIKVARTL